MNHEAAFLQAMVDDPLTALLFADWLEEHGDPRGELLRLTHFLTQMIDQPNRPALEERLRALVAAGTPPVGPFRTNSVGMRFAWIPPGAFLMGSPPNEPERQDYRGTDETRHRVTLTKGYWLGVHPVTQEQWHAVMGDNPSKFRGDHLPVEQVRWNDAVAFCEALGRKEGHSYRLPTEAQWEYACRAGTTTPFHFGVSISPDQANYNGKYAYGDGKSGVWRAETAEDGHKGVYREKTTPVGSFPANAWGLYDVHGNVSEWCADRFGPYDKEDEQDPLGASNGEPRVNRGGCWGSHPRRCRSAFRYWLPPDFRVSTTGLRAALFLH